MGRLNKNNKIKSFSSREEVYKFGCKKGFGKGLGLCIAFLRKRGQLLLHSKHYQTLEKEMKDYVLQRRV